MLPAHQVGLCSDSHTVTPRVKPYCPCTPLEFPAMGACPEGYQCTNVKILPPEALPAAARPSTDDLAICVPCVHGQYCPAGSFQPSEGQALVDYANRYACRYVHPYLQAGTRCSAHVGLHQCLANKFHAGLW